MAKIAVIGGGAAGMMFSTQYKKMNPGDEIFIFEKTPYVAWAGCPTPYYIAGELGFGSVVLGTPDEFRARGLNVLVNHEVKKVDFEKKELEISGAEVNGAFQYDKLILAMSSAALTA